MKRQLHVDLVTRGRVWLEANSIPLPDPWADDDITLLIAQFYPGGRFGFVLDAAPEAVKAWRRRGREEERLAHKAEIARALRARNPEKHRAAQKNYYAAHKRDILQKQHENRERNKEAA